MAAARLRMPRFFLGGRSTSCEKILRILNCIGTATYVASDVGFLSLVEARCYFDTAHATFSSFCVCVLVGSVPMWRRVHFDFACATFSSLCACQIALVVAACLFSHRSRNRLVTLCLLARFRCGAVLIVNF